MHEVELLDAVGGALEDLVLGHAVRLAVVAEQLGEPVEGAVQVVVG